MENETAQEETIMAKPNPNEHVSYLANVSMYFHLLLPQFIIFLICMSIGLFIILLGCIFSNDLKTILTGVVIASLCLLFICLFYLLVPFVSYKKSLKPSDSEILFYEDHISFSTKSNSVNGKFDIPLSAIKSLRIKKEYCYMTFKVGNRKMSMTFGIRALPENELNFLKSIQK